MTLFRYPKIFEDETVGPEAKKLFTEAEVKTYITDIRNCQTIHIETYIYNMNYHYDILQIMSKH